MTKNKPLIDTFDSIDRLILERSVTDEASKISSIEVNHDALVLIWNKKNLLKMLASPMWRKVAVICHQQFQVEGSYKKSKSEHHRPEFSELEPNFIGNLPKFQSFRCEELLWRLFVYLESESCCVPTKVTVSTLIIYKPVLESSTTSPAAHFSFTWIRIGNCWIGKFGVKE